MTGYCVVVCRPTGSGDFRVPHHYPGKARGHPGCLQDLWHCVHCPAHGEHPSVHESDTNTQGIGSVGTLYYFLDGLSLYTGIKGVWDEVYQRYHTFFLSPEWSGVSPGRLRRSCRHTRGQWRHHCWWWWWWCSTWHCPCCRCWSSWGREFYLHRIPQKEVCLFPVCKW